MHVLSHSFFGHISMILFVGSVHKASAGDTNFRTISRLLTVTTVTFRAFGILTGKFGMNLRLRVPNNALIYLVLLCTAQSVIKYSL